MADAILASFQDPVNPERLRVKAEAFALDRAIDRYLAVLLSERLSRGLY